MSITVCDTMLPLERLADQQTSDGCNEGNYNIIDVLCLT